MVFQNGIRVSAIGRKVHSGKISADIYGEHNTKLFVLSSKFAIPSAGHPRPSWAPDEIECPLPGSGERH
jgi:hypothetical protein